MAKIFQPGDEVTVEWLNKVSKTVTDGLGDKNTPTDIRNHIGAEVSGAAGTVQADLDSHKASTAIHFPDAPNDTKDYVRGQGIWKPTALTEAPIDGETYGRRNAGWSVVSGTGATDHQALLNREALDAHPKSSITGLDQDITNLDAHRANILNPHQVTAVQVGADPTGSASAVQGNLDTHTANTTNPHNVTTTQIGADPAGSADTVQNDLDAHKSATNNPHVVTALQVGADTSAEVDGKIQTHFTTAPHIVDTGIDGIQYARINNTWSPVSGANIEEYSLVAATSAGTVEADINATDFTGHSHAGANTYVTVQANHIATVAHGADLYKFIGDKPINLGLGGDVSVAGDQDQVITLRYRIGMLLTHTLFQH